MFLRAFVLIAALIGGIWATSSSPCSLSNCNDRDVNSTFKKHHTYIYDYNVEIQTERNESTSSNKSNIVKINATVEIYEDSFCNLILKLDDVIITGGRYENNNISSSLKEYVLVFQYENGLVTKICAHQKDTNWNVNVKLGILSALQYSLQDDSSAFNITQVNVFGECDSSYNISEVDGWTVVRRETNLNRCNYRAGYKKKTLNVLEKPNISAMAFVKSLQKCKHVIGKTGQPVLITCRENYVIDPFEASTRLYLRQKLDLDRVVVKSTPDLDDSAESIDILSLKMNYFENMEYRYPYFADRLKHQENIVEAIIYSIEIYAYDQNDRILSKIVNLLQDATQKELNTVLSKCKDEHINYLINAISFGLTEDTLQMVIDLYQKGKINDDQIHKCLSSLPFLKKPTEKSLKNLQSLLKVADLQPVIQLGLSGLIHNYCNEIPDCMDTLEVQSIINEIEAPLHLKYNEADLDDLVVALISIRNIGRSRSSEEILSISLNKNLPKMLRLAAIDTYERLPCQNASRWRMMPNFADMTEDSEIMLKTYLAVMKCPSDAIITAFNDILRGDSVNQVTSFIWKHMTALQNTSNTFDGDLGRILIDNDNQLKYRTTSNTFTSVYDIELPNNNDDIKYSKTIDLENEPFVMKSFLKMFNEKINIFQLNVRLEKLKRILANHFNSKKNCDHDAMENSRSMQNEIEYTSENNEHVEYLNDQAKLGLLSNDIYYLNALNLHKRLENNYASMKQSSQPSFNYKRSFDLINEYSVYLTGVGLPLKISIEGNINFAISTMAKISQKQQNNCEIDFEAISQINTTAMVKSLMMIDITDDQIGTESEDQSNEYKAFNHKVEYGKQNQVHLITGMKKAQFQPDY